MQVVRQADDSFVCFGAKPDKGFWTRDLDVTGSGEGTPVREWDKKGTEKWAVGEGRRREAVDTGHWSREASRHERGSRPVKEGRVKMSRRLCCFVEVSLEIQASVGLHMYTGNAVLHNSLSALELTPSVGSFVLFSSCSLDCISCSVRKFALPLSEPLVDHRP